MMNTIERVEAIRVALGARQPWRHPGAPLHPYLDSLDIIAGMYPTRHLQVGARLALHEQNRGWGIPVVQPDMHLGEKYAARRKNQRIPDIFSAAAKAFPLERRYMYLGEGAER